MKICSIHIKGYQQFEDTFLDFTHPETGEPLDKICLIGRNGTGKSTVLQMISQVLQTNSFSNISSGKILLKLQTENGYYYLLITAFDKKPRYFYLEDGVEFFLSSLMDNKVTAVDHLKLIENNIKYKISTIDTFAQPDFRLSNKVSDLIVFSPSESTSNLGIQVTDVPTTTLNEALGLFHSFDIFHNISSLYSFTNTYIDFTIKSFSEYYIFFLKFVKYFF